MLPKEVHLSLQVILKIKLFIKKFEENYYVEMFYYLIPLIDNVDIWKQVKSKHVRAEKMR